MKKTILIVEDDPGIRTTLRELLESAGYRVDTASDGGEALDQLRSSPTPPSLIILDLMLPVIDAYQFRKEQEADPKLSQIPVVITTAGGNIEAKTYSLGAKAYLKKPYDMDDVLDVARRFSR